MDMINVIIVKVEIQNKMSQEMFRLFYMIGRQYSKYQSEES